MRHKNNFSFQPWLMIFGYILLFFAIGWGITKIYDYIYWVNFTEEGRDFRATFDPEWARVRAQEEIGRALREQNKN